MTNSISVPERAGLRDEVRMGVLETRTPFIDTNDLSGSRARAFNTYRLSIESSLLKQGPQDWLAGAACALSGFGPFATRALGALALDEQSAEVGSLASLAKAHRLKLTLAAWWRGSDNGITAQMLIFDSNGQLSVQPFQEYCELDGVQLFMPVRRSIPIADIAKLCRQTGSFGVCVEARPATVLPPGAPALPQVGSYVIDPDGRLLARAQ